MVLKTFEIDRLLDLDVLNGLIYINFVSTSFDVDRNNVEFSRRLVGTYASMFGNGASQKEHLGSLSSRSSSLING